MHKWREQTNPKDTLWLLSKDEVEKIPNGTILKSVLDEYETKSKVNFIYDLTGRGGWGLTAIMAESQGLGSLFTMLMLRS